MKTSLQNFLNESDDHKDLLKSIEGSNIFSKEITDKYTIVKEKYPDWKDPNAEQVAKTRKKELESQGYSVKLKKWNFVDLARGYSWSVTAIKEKVTENKMKTFKEFVNENKKPELTKKELKKRVDEEAKRIFADIKKQEWWNDIIRL